MKRQLHLEAEQVDLKEKVEERLVGLEQQLNKRFLEIDGQFTTFKGVVVDEVEALMGDLDNYVKEKSDKIESNVTKLNFVIGEANKRLADLGKVDELVENQVRDIRDEVNDMRVKLEITGPGSAMHSMNQLVESMSEYEDQLIALVSSLKSRNIDDQSIKEALLKKGHPRMYVSMILEKFDELTQ